jgi:hypothetical protein
VGKLHALTDQVAIDLIGQQLHEPHSAADQHAADSMAPLVVEMGGQALHVQ